MQRGVSLLVGLAAVAFGLIVVYQIEFVATNSYDGDRVTTPAVLFATFAVVCTEKLNPNVMVMKSAKDGVRFDASDPVNRARDRRIFVQGPMRSNVIVITSVGLQDAAQMRLAEDDKMSSAGHAGAKANAKLTFDLNH